MANKIQWYRGATLNFQITLFTTTDGSDIKIAYPIPTGATVEVHLPGETASVVLSSAVVGEVTIVNAAEGIISCVCSPTKSLLLAIGTSLAIDVKILTLDSKVFIAEKVKVMNIADPING
jgi:hypothetical protein